MHCNIGRTSEMSWPYAFELGASPVAAPSKGSSAFDRGLLPLSLRTFYSLGHRSNVSVQPSLMNHRYSNQLIGPFPSRHRPEDTTDEGYKLSKTNCRDTSAAPGPGRGVVEDLWASEEQYLCTSPIQRVSQRGSTISTVDR